MCWSGEASAAVAVAGAASGIYAWRKGESKLLYIPILYFAGMETLQAYTYSVIDQCSNTHNQTATMIAYAHISFQPVFINAFSLYFVPEQIRKRIINYVLAFSAFCGFLFLLRLYPFPSLAWCYDASYNFLFCPSCSFPVPLCGHRLCAVSGTWHIAWEIPLKFQLFWDNMYVLSAFILPVLYGSWKVTLYLFLVGPFLAAFTTNNANEWPAVWCLFSTAIIGIALQPKLRKWLHVRRWFWKRLPKGGPERV